MKVKKLEKMLNKLENELDELVNTYYAVEEQIAKKESAIDAIETTIMILSEKED